MSEPQSGITVYSCLKGTLQILSETNPNARILCLGLAPWYIYNKEDYKEYMQYEKDVNTVIKNCCEEYNIQYVDLFSELGWNFYNANKYYTKSSGVEEGSDVSNRQVHPNDNGQMVIAKILSNYF
jgi:lysophospholipase L1-like esterase